MWCGYGIRLTVLPKYSYLGFVMGIFHTIKPDSGLVPIREVYVLLPEKMKEPLYTDRKNLCQKEMYVYPNAQFFIYLNSYIS